MKRIEDFNKILPVNELYTAVQAEGSRTGYPTVVVRTVGCTHRCAFGEGGWCDAWANSIHPEKGKYTFNDIIKIYDENPHITEMMLTGGAPTMHPVLINELVYFTKERGIFLTMETEGSHFVETDLPIDLVSLSPKFSNSIPRIGIKTPLGDTVDEKFIKQHNKFRMKTDIMKQMLDFHSDYHIKPVWDGSDQQTLQEILDFLEELEIPKEKVYFMPAGDSRDKLVSTYPKVMNWVRDNGFKFTGRPHIIAFDTLRRV